MRSQITSIAASFALIMGCSPDFLTPVSGNNPGDPEIPDNPAAQPEPEPHEPDTPTPQICRTLATETETFDPLSGPFITETSFESEAFTLDTVVNGLTASWEYDSVEAFVRESQTLGAIHWRTGSLVGMPATRQTDSSGLTISFESYTDVTDIGMTWSITDWDDQDRPLTAAVEVRRNDSTPTPDRCHVEATWAYHDATRQMIFRLGEAASAQGYCLALVTRSTYDHHGNTLVSESWPSVGEIDGDPLFHQESTIREIEQICIPG